MNVTQKIMRQGVRIGNGLSDVSSVSYWLRHCHFKNEDEARGALRLAHQQGLDGMGKSIRQWMGITEVQFSAWMQNEEIPKFTKYPRASPIKRSRSGRSELESPNDSSDTAE